MLDTRVGVINGLLTGLGIVGHPIPFLASVAWVWPALIIARYVESGAYL